MNNLISSIGFVYDRVASIMQIFLADFFILNDIRPIQKYYFRI